MDETVLTLMTVRVIGSAFAAARVADAALWTRRACPTDVQQGRPADPASSVRPAVQRGECTLPGTGAQQALRAAPAGIR